METIKKTIRKRKKKKKTGKPGRKPGKDRKPLDLRPAVIDKLIADRESITATQNRVAALKDPDFSYLYQVFDAMKARYEELPDSLIEFDNKKLRYTPKKMMSNATTFVEATLGAKQPLTITGLGLFMGMHRKQLFNLLNAESMKGDPRFEFIYDFCDFIEMYNEYAAHKKQNPAGPIFILKNFGWKDKFEIEASRTEGALTEAERALAQKRVNGITE